MALGRVTSARPGRSVRARALLLGLGLACRPAESSTARPASASPPEAPQPDSSPTEPHILATYEPTPPEVVEAMLELAQLTSADRMVDLGSGDGRLVIAAARDYGAEAVGVEYDEQLVRRSREAIAAAGLQDRARIVQGDLHDYPLAGTTVLTLFLWPTDNMRLRDAILRELSPGARVVSHDHDMGDWAPDETLEVESEEFSRRYDDTSMLYLWIVPAAFAGCWTDDEGEVRAELDQYFQHLQGTLVIRGRALTLDAGPARGSRATLIARDEEGAVDLGIVADDEQLRLSAPALELDVALHACEGGGS